MHTHCKLTQPLQVAVSAYFPCLAASSGRPGCDVALRGVSLLLDATLSASSLQLARAQVASSDFAKSAWRRR